MSPLTIARNIQRLAGVFTATLVAANLINLVVRSFQ